MFGWRYGYWNKHKRFGWQLISSATCIALFNTYVEMINSNKERLGIKVTAIILRKNSLWTCLWFTHACCSALWAVQSFAGKRLLSMDIKNITFWWLFSLHDSHSFFLRMSSLMATSTFWRYHCNIVHIDNTLYVWQPWVATFL